MAKIYVASSWRNPYQPEVVTRLREAGHEVYDFRNPEDNPGGFHWSDIAEDWQEWSVGEYIGNLTHPVAEKGFKADFDAMLCLKTIVYIPEKQEPELMYKIFDKVVGSIEDLIEATLTQSL